MSRQQSISDFDSPLRTYRSRYKGPIVLVCRKCRRKLEHSDAHSHAAHLKKSLRKLGKVSDAPPIHVTPVPCMKLCPKGAVTVCTQADLAQSPPTLTLIRTRKDIAALYRQCTDAHPAPTSRALLLKGEE